MTDPAMPAWSRLLDGLLQGDAELDDGAQLVVSDESGSEIFVAPLARHWRLDDDDPQCLWVRPIHQALPDPTAGTPQGAQFELAACRRRALQFSSVRVDGARLVFELWNGDVARIAPMDGRARRVLAEWDAFVLTQLPAAVEAELDALQDGS